VWGDVCEVCGGCFPLAFEHSKVCTLCDFGHLQFLKLLFVFSEIWGPFLVITPASTLHNWQQEVAKFVPSFKVVPYWGSPQERKILRQFWDQTNLHQRSSSFHLVITSYQVCIY
jgi:SNF2 family DNA or RNA helicase